VYVVGNAQLYSGGDMKSRWLALVLALGAAACTAEAPAEETQDTGQVEAGVPSAAESEVVYVDVRTPEEYASGHVQGAINIPHTEMADRHGELAEYRDDELVLYCRSGRRSGIAKGILDGAGFDNVMNGGGLADLQARGVPTTR
jgi:phage shock protein E